jgi:hypothetical protein
MCTIDALAQLLDITLASLCRRERAAFTGKPGPDVLYLQVNALNGRYVTYISETQREGSYLCCSRAVTTATVSFRCRGDTTASH